MSKRPNHPSAHANENKSRDRLRTTFHSFDWIVWDLSGDGDYGEDQLVRIVENTEVTHYAFLVQAKSSEKIKFHQDGKTFSYPIEIKNVENWRHFWEPVILTIWDKGSDITYWEIIQDYFDSNNVDFQNQDEISIRIHADNILDEDGLKSIYIRTRKRFERFEQERNGSKILVRWLEEALATEVEYDPTGLILMRKPDGGARVELFGELAEEYSRLASELGVSTEEALERSISSLHRFLEEGGDIDHNRIEITDSRGNIKYSFRSYRDLMRHVDKQAELKAYKDLGLDGYE